MPHRLMPRGKGSFPIAYYIEHALPWETGPIPWHIREYFDCYGQVFGRANTWYQRKVYGLAKLWTPSYTGYGSGTMGNVKADGIMVDVRTLEMIQAGCCPPDLLIQFMLSEEAPD